MGYKFHFLSLVWFSKFWEIFTSENWVSELTVSFKTDSEFQISCWDLSIFKLQLLCIFELNLKCGQKKTCRENQGYKFCIEGFVQIAMDYELQSSESLGKISETWIQLSL